LGLENAAITSGDYSYYLGGLAGGSKGGSITNCYVVGSVSAHDYSACLGGLLGKNEGCGITNCHVTGNVIAGHDSQSLGGLIGWNERGLIINCYTIGDVRDGNRSTGVGGLVGSTAFGGIIRQCYSMGNVSTGNDASCVGGLVGLCRLDWDGIITASYSSCSIIAGDNVKHVGGLVGILDNGEFDNCYAGGSVNCGKSVGVGGLVGIYDGIMSNCYATAIVSAGNDSTSIGGLIGEKDRTCGAINICENSFWDTDTSGLTISDGGVGRETAEMQTASTFINAGWDFIGETENGTSQIWQMPEGEGYPVLAMLSGYAPHPLEGLGTPENPYLISDALDLGAMVHYRPDAHYQMTASIDLSGIRWGTEVIPLFAGTFDGNDLSVSHLTISGGGYLGLFGELASGSMVKNLGIIDVNVTGSGDYIAALASNNHGTIARCYSTGTVDATGIAEGAANCVGGLVAFNCGSVTQCHSTIAASGGLYTGGIVGWNTGTMARCYSACLVHANERVGGLIGWNFGDVSCCYNWAAVTGDSFVGGLVGENYSGRIADCYSNGAVNGQGYVGGLVGRNIAVVIDCFWDTQTSGQTSSAGGTGKTTAEMQMAHTFLEAGWDFVGETANGTEDIWWIDEGQDYPRLWWDK
jgi:hypothetical protein